MSYFKFITLLKNLANNSIFKFFLYFILKLLLILFFISFAFNLNISNILEQKNIPEIVKITYLALFYISILSSIYFSDKNTFFYLVKEKNKLNYFFEAFYLGIFLIILYFSFNLLLDFLVINNIIFSYLIKSCFLFIILSFLIAFIEEVLFRSFFFRIIKEKTTNIKAYFISSYIYTQSHFLNFNLPIKSIYLNFIGLFILGLILNLFYDKKGLFYSIGFHTAIIFVISLINVNNVFEINENYIFLSGGLNPLNGFLGVFYALILLVFFYNYQKTS